MEQVKEELEERDNGPRTVVCVLLDALQAQEREGLSRQASHRWLFRPDKWVLAGRERCCWRRAQPTETGGLQNGRRVVAEAGT